MRSTTICRILKSAISLPGKPVVALRRNSTGVSMKNEAVRVGKGPMAGIGGVSPPGKLPDFLLRMA